MSGEMRAVDIQPEPQIKRPRACLVSGADEIRLRSYVNHAIYARTHGLDYRLECGLDRGITNKFFYKTSIIRRVHPNMSGSSGLTTTRTSRILNGTISTRSLTRRNGTATSWSSPTGPRNRTVSGLSSIPALCSSVTILAA